MKKNTEPQSQYKLKQARTFLHQGKTNSFGTFTILGSMDNLEAATYDIVVAVKLRAFDTPISNPKYRTIFVARPIYSNYNSFMGQANLKADLYVVEDQVVHEF